MRLRLECPRRHASRAEKQDHRLTCYVHSMEHYFPNVPGLGNVAVSRHAQDRLREDGIPESAFQDALINGDTIPDGHDVIWREKHGIRVVILRKPEPFAGAMLVKTVYRIEGAARARKG
jgi:hypothetical protein